MKKVVVMTTGGTIAMKYDPVTQGLIPAVSGDDLIEAVPALREIAEVEVVEFSNVPSGHITPQMMFDLAKMADRYAEREDVSGIVVTHGTDTLEETAYMLGLAVKTNKPVCLTGAMRGASETGPDGPANILAAVMVAASDEALGKGALLIFNDEIHAAAEVTKTHTTSCATFHSPGWGPIGHIYFDRVVFRRQPLNLEKICPAVLAEDVPNEIENVSIFTNGSSNIINGFLSLYIESINAKRIHIPAKSLQPELKNLISLYCPASFFKRLLCISKLYILLSVLSDTISKYSLNLAFTGA